jgi:hypothetical protein
MKTTDDSTMSLDTMRFQLATGPRVNNDWRRWGPYLSERQWGTVREDYSPGGTAWDYFPHAHARSRAYRWGEDGLAGICDDRQRLCFALALWNGVDPILKERFFGLTNSEGNHGEDVKELYWYLDATPSHSYLKMLYKYPQRAFPYAQLLEENARRKENPALPEFELLDTGLFDEDRYWDVFVEYAKASPEDLLVRITVHNRGPEESTLHVLPQLWFRNIWSWKPDGKKRALRTGEDGSVIAEHHRLGEYRLYADRTGIRGACPSKGDWLFTENNTNPRIFGAAKDGYFKDAFHEYVVHGNKAAVNPAPSGTKAAAHYVVTVPAQGSREIRLRLCRSPRDSNVNSPGCNPGTAESSSTNPEGVQSFDPFGVDIASNETPRVAPGAIHLDSLRESFAEFDSIFRQRITEADAFYRELQQDIADADARLVQRQAVRGDDLEQAVLLLRRAGMVERRSGPAAAPGGTKARAQQRMVPLEQRRHRFHAGQVGVPVVCGVGPGIPLHSIGDDRCGVREEPARAADARMVHAPERPAPGLRMGLRRCEPARACLGGLARVPNRSQAAARATSG